MGGGGGGQEPGTTQPGPFITSETSEHSRIRQLPDYLHPLEGLSITDCILIDLFYCFFGPRIIVTISCSQFINNVFLFPVYCHY